MATWALVDITRGGLIQQIAETDQEKTPLPSDPGPGGSLLEWHVFNRGNQNVKHAPDWRWDGSKFVHTPYVPPPPAPVDPSPGTFDVLQHLIDTGVITFAALPAAWKQHLNP